MELPTQICKNGCEFALRSTLLAYTVKEGDQYSDADYHWRCTKVDKLITSNSLIYELGCASYNYVRQPEQCICTPKPVEKPTPAVVEPIVTVAEPQVERVEPKFVPEPAITTPAAEPAVVPQAVPKVRKPRMKPAVTVTDPIEPVMATPNPTLPSDLNEPR